MGSGPSGITSVVHRKKLLLYVREEYAGFFARLDRALQADYDLCYLTPTVKAERLLREMAGYPITSYCLESAWLNYEYRPSSKEIADLEEAVGEPLFLTCFAELYMQQVLGNIYYCRERDKAFYERLGYFYFSFLDQLLTTEEPHCVLFECFNAPFALICDRLATKRGIFSFAMMPHYLENTFFFGAGRAHRNAQLEYLYRNPGKITAASYARAREFLAELNRTTQFTPSYLSPIIPKKPTFVRALVRALGNRRKLTDMCRAIRAIGEYLMTPRDRIVRSFVPNPVLYLMDEHLIRRRNRKALMRVVSRAVNEERYYVFFLMFQPEATTSAQAPFFAKQEYLIEQIAISLPARYMLYVKEHPMDVGRRGKSFYDRFKYYPNIRVVDPFSSSRQLVVGSEGVITITGTVGFEALFLTPPRPVIIFGDVFYDCSDRVIKVKDLTQLPQVFRDIEAGRPCQEQGADEAIQFAAAYLQSMQKGVVSSVLAGYLEPENVVNVSRSIDSFMKSLASDGLAEFMKDFMARA
jgi:hypothetical protein